MATSSLQSGVLSHGADPNAMLPPAKKPRSNPARALALHEMAMRRGQAEMADLLVRFGAEPSAFVPTDEDRYITACLRLDRAEAQRIIAQHPEFIRSPKAIFEATRRDHVEAMRLLVDLGTSIEVEDESEQRPLHVAGWSNAVNAARFLVDKGAAIDPVEKNWGNSPIDMARWNGYQTIVDLLAPYSRDLWSLAFTGKVDRLRELLTADASLAKWELANGVTPLMRLPDDEAKAYEIAKLFIDQGADPHRRNDEGLTAIDMAEKRELKAVAELLRSKSRGR